MGKLRKVGTLTWRITNEMSIIRGRKGDEGRSHFVIIINFLFSYEK